MSCQDLSEDGWDCMGSVWEMPASMLEAYVGVVGSRPGPASAAQSSQRLIRDRAVRGDMDITRWKYCVVLMTIMTPLLLSFFFFNRLSVVKTHELNQK